MSKTLWRRWAGLVGIGVIISVACAGAPAQEPVGDAASRGRALAHRVLQEQDTSGFQIRGRVIVGVDEENGPRPSILQVRIIGRRQNGVTRILHQILWPPALKGLAAVIEHTQTPAISGFLFEPPERITRLTPTLLAAPFAGTGLTLEDLAENFWLWPRQRVAGEGRAGDQACTILESRPSPEEISAYALVRSCLSMKKATPLWVEKMGADGKLIKRIAFETPDRKGGGTGFRAAMVVEGGAPAQRTRVEILKSERGMTISPAEFTVERLKSLAAK
jgi:hypothetical protein